ncbi:MAG TPA: hypothetical protein VGV85_06295 [Longimicrobiaceae bacterium]|nr:hypothetical protein [Longimicrobiaceae bacterium]
MRTFTRWGFVVLVLVLDVVTIFFDLLGPELRWATATVLTAVLAAVALGLVLERSQHREQQRAAYASLARANAARDSGNP